MKSKSHIYGLCRTYLEKRRNGTFKVVVFNRPFLCACVAAPVAPGSSQARGPIRAEAKAYTTAMAYPSHICDLYCSLQEHRILNPLSEARDRTHILMDTSWVLNLLSHSGNSLTDF